MPNIGKVLAIVAVAGAVTYGREVLVALQFVEKTVEILLGVL
jgi:hypothetical protein